MLQPNHSLARGLQAEALGVSYLEGLGYRPLIRNYRCQGGELDLIAWHGDVLCFVEIRARANDACGTPLETINRTKIRRIIVAARTYLDKRWQGPWPEMRFDALGILLQDPPVFDLVQSAFETQEASWPAC